MATQDNGSGLLSKVAKFVLNPTVDWEHLDKPGQARAIDNSKLALKHMIERKHYNDAVRKREFDKLRKLRLNPMMPVVAALATTGYHDSWGYSAFEERANTLKKIDEIEAQMSKQWWKGDAAGGVSPVGRAAASVPRDIRDLDSAFATTMPADLSDDEADVPTKIGVGIDPGHLRQMPGQADAVNTSQTFSGAFSVQPPAVVEMDAPEADANLEEAAIRFANKDDGGAELVLLTALQAPAPAPDLTRAWAFGLLDIYRATGQQDSFERMATDYARRSGNPAPTWVAIESSSQDLAAPSAGEADSVMSASADGQLQWNCPAILDAAALQALQGAALTAQTPCQLDWRALRRIAPATGQALAVLWARWCAMPLKLSMVGVETLVQLLRELTVMGDTDVPPCWWQLRLDLLRMLRRPDEFELVALDFCVTYEISPPSWIPASCQIVLSTGVQPPANNAPPIDKRPAVVQPQSLALTGELLGEATLVLDALCAAAPAGQTMVVSCANLVRVDFSAAGSMLNWLANAQAAGMRIELRDVPHLIAAFFQLIGINQHAEIFTRTY